MTRLTAVMICGIGIAIGLSFGAGFNVGSLSTLAQADSLSRTQAEDIYRELDTGGSSLAETSRVLAKISRVVMPSVVHINSVRTIVNRGQVEETGSGVVMTSSRRPGVYIITNRHVIADAISDLN